MKARDCCKFALAALVFSHGCATLPPDSSVASKRSGLPEGSGLVIAETSNNSRRITGYVDHWKELFLWRQNYEGEDDTWRITALDQSHTTQTYMGVVPAGTYRVGVLRTEERMGDITYYAYARVPRGLGTFEVRAGGVTNLGTIVYHPFQARHRAEEAYPDYAITRFANGDLVRIARTLYPEFMTETDSEEPVSGWLSDSFGEVRQETARLIKNAAVPMDMHLLRDGRHLLTGSIGALYVLDKGQWQNRSLSHNYEITGLVELPSGELLIGSEFGRLTIGELDGAFRDIPMGGQPRHVIDVVASDAGEAYVVSDVIDSYEIHQYQPASRSVSLLKVLPKRGASIWSMHIPRPAVIGTTNGIAAFIDKKVHRFDETSDSWSTDEAAEFYALHEQPDGTVTGIPGHFWTGVAPIHYSEDDGRTWAATRAEESLLFVGIGSWAFRPPYRFGDGEIIRTARDQRFSLRKWEYEATDFAPVMSTTDDGAAWTQIGSVPSSCLDIAAEASTDDRVYILCDDGRAIVSADRGRNWQEVQREPKVPAFQDFPPQLKVRYTSGDEMEEQQSIAPMVPTLLQQSQNN